MTLAEAQRQFQLALEYRRTWENQEPTLKEHEALEEAVARASRELITLWLETLAV